MYDSLMDGDNTYHSSDAKMLRVKLLKVAENIDMMSKKIQESARKLKAIDIENYMAELCGNAFKSAWMIKATLRKG